MTTFKLKLNQIKQLLSLEVKLESATLADGMVVNYEKLEAGFPIFAEDGVTPLPEGEYIMEDGTKLEVDMNGVIMEVVTSEVPEVAAPVETPVETPVEVPVAAAEVPVVDAPADPMAEMMAAMDKKISTCLEAIDMIVQEMSAMKQKMEAFSAAPAATKIPKISKTEEVKAERVDLAIDAIKKAMKS